MLTVRMMLISIGVQSSLLSIMCTSHIVSSLASFISTSVHSQQKKFQYFIIIKMVPFIMFRLIHHHIYPKYLPLTRLPPFSFVRSVAFNIKFQIFLYIIHHKINQSVNPNGQYHPFEC